MRRAREAAKGIVEEGARPEDVGVGSGASPPKDFIDGGTKVRFSPRVKRVCF